MKAAIYARVSTLDKGQDAEVQLRDLRSYAQARGWIITGEYVDKGESGWKDHRPQLDRLMEDARKRRIDVILVWKLDRLGRSLKHLMLTMDELQSIGVGFVSYGENLDLTTSAGRLMFQLLGAFAEFERNRIRERVISGLNHAKAKGKILGRPGKSLDVARVLDLRSQGWSLKKIGDAMGISHTLVNKTLSKSALKVQSIQGSNEAV